MPELKPGESRPKRTYRVDPIREDADSTEALPPGSTTPKSQQDPVFCTASPDYSSSRLDTSVDSDYVSRFDVLNPPPSASSKDIISPGSMLQSVEEDTSDPFDFQGDELMGESLLRTATTQEMDNRSKPADKSSSPEPALLARIQESLFGPAKPALRPNGNSTTVANSQILAHRGQISSPQVPIDAVARPQMNSDTVQPTQQT